jgi:hypothetical protein
MRLTQNRIYSEFCPTEVTESLKIVAHCGLHRHLLLFEFATRNKVNNVLLAERFSNPNAAFTIEDLFGFYKSDRNVPILSPYLQNIFSNNIINTLGDEAIIINRNFIKYIN